MREAGATLIGCGIHPDGAFGDVEHVDEERYAEVARQLGYKCAMRGGTVVRVGRFYPSSKTCSCCGHVVEELPLSVRRWQCPQCGESHDRDVNAARNILAEGLRILKEKGTAGLAGTAA